ncbi:MAG: glycosyltransferase family 39 protein [Spirochaetes bacterium]|nr:glycosyltransferase family 39 protein [Spirochaetota bacterium]
MNALDTLRKNPLLIFGVVLSAILLVIKIFFITNTMVADDEAHYALWAHHLALGYFDHEPMIAYMNLLFTTLFGETSFGLRLGGIIVHLAGSFVLYLLGKDVRDAATGFVLVILWNLTPFFAGNSFIVTTDTPSLLFLFTAVWLYHNAFFKDKRYFYIAGLALGLALFSRISAAGVGLGIAVFVLTSGKRFVYLRSKELWISVLIALLVYTPFLIWNAQNEWAFFDFAFGRQVKKAGGGLKGLLETWGGQLGLYFPVMFFSLAVLMPVTLLTTVRRVITGAPDEKDDSAKRFFFAVISFVPFCYIFYKSLTAKVEANWPAFIYPGVTVLLALFLTARSERRRWRMGVFTVNNIISFAAIAAVLIHTVTPFLPVSEQLDVTRRYHYYQAFNGSLKDFYSTSMDTNTRIAGLNYQVPSLANFYLKPKREAVCLDLGTYHPTVFNFWYRDSAFIGEDMYIIIPSTDNTSIIAASNHFTDFKMLRSFDSLRNGKPVSSFTVYHGRRYLGNGKKQ